MKPKTVVLAVLFILMLMAAGCGASGGSANLNSAKTGTVQVTMGDAPSDSVVSFSVSLDSIVLTGTGGAATSILPEPTRIELAHLAGITTPVATVDIPQGTYTSIAITLSAPQVTLIRPLTGDTITRDLSLTVTKTIQLDPALELGGTAVNLNLDLSLADSVFVDSAGNVTFNPKFLVRHSRLVAAALLLPRLEPIVGQVEAVSGNTFAINVRFGRATLRINTDDQTQFVGISGIGSLTPGAIVSAFVRFGDNGHLLATKVISMPPPAALAVEGLVKSATGSPVTQFTVITRDGIGRLLPWLAGRTININAGGSTVFGVDADNLDLSALPFPAVFDASSLVPGQAVEVHTPEPSLAITINSISINLTASHVTLEAQPVAGQVAGFSGGDTFTLVLPPESAIARLTQSTTLPVFMEPGKTRLAGTVSDGSVTLVNGKSVIVRGLLFVDGGQYKLAATRVLIEE